MLTRTVLESALFDPKHNAHAIIKILHTPIISEKKMRFVALGSCLAANIAKYLRRVNATCFFERDNCRHFSSESLLDILRQVSQEDIKNIKIY